MTSPNPTSTFLLNTSLVIGGCGFLGYHIVQHLLKDDESGAVYVVDRNISRNRHDEATYICGDMTDSELLRSLVADIKPLVIFHCASPIASLPARREDEYFKTNVRGTESLLTISAENKSVHALVYTSSVDVYSNPPHTNVDESQPLWSSDDRSNEYNRTKAIADGLVREANGPQLRTVCLRLGHAYGERHIQGMVEVLDMCAKNKKLVQIGQGENVMEVVSADNSAMAHVLAAKALLDPGRATGKIDGEAFNISDGAPVPFWHHIRVIWGAVRGKDVLKEVVVLPSWVMIVAVNLAEWLFWLFTLNTVKPPVELRRVSLEYTLYTHTYNIEKARGSLSFNPVSDHDVVLEQSARWMLEHRETIK